MATKAEQIRNLVRAFGGEPRESTIEDAIEDLVAVAEAGGIGSGGGGGAAPDMVITISGSIDGLSPSQCAVTSGDISIVASKLRSGESPVIKIRNVKDTGNLLYSEFDAFITTYGENYWLSSIVIYPVGPGYYKVNMTLFSDGSINTASSASI